MTTVDPPEVDIPAGESTVATYGAIWAELPPNTDKPVTEINRFGIRIYLSVGEGGEPPSSFTLGKLQTGSDPNGRQLVTAPVTNTGGRALDVTGELRLSDRLTNVGPFRASTVTLAPGQEGVLVVPIRPATARGPWNAQLDAASGTITESKPGRITLPKPKKRSASPRATRPATGCRPRSWSEWSPRSRGGRGPLDVPGAVTSLLMIRSSERS